MQPQPDQGPATSTVFITGATGFIGQNLVKGLLASGHRVRVLIRPGLHSEERVPGGCEQVSANLLDTEKLAEIIAATDAVIYCAGSVRGRDAADFARANVDGVEAMTQALEKSGHRPPLLLISSLAASRPQLSHYADSKFKGEQVLSAHADLPWTILRPPAVYGPGDKEMLPLLQWARRGYAVHPGPREQHLSLLYVTDLVRAIEAWLAKPQNGVHRIFSIDDGTPGGYDWPAIAESVSERPARLVRLPRIVLNLVAVANLCLSYVFRYAPMLTPGKVRELCQPEWLCDNSEFMAATGWRPKLNLTEGARRLFAVEGNTEPH
ncbi:MAG: NAD(P)-dependent oxidoreductase [Xanthomonadales bacterium]|nr:NAD(P)-dependent oxidoreductase [Xanthomonadales bacterium]